MGKDKEFIAFTTCIHCDYPQNFGGGNGIHCINCGNYAFGSNEEWRKFIYDYITNKDKDKDNEQ